MDYVLNMRRALLLAILTTTGAALLLLLPGVASAATQVDPADGAHFTHLELATMVQFDPTAGEHPKWVLLASDPAMKTTVRYCRQFVWAATADKSFHWGCNRWATGVDQLGNDKLVALEEDHVYYWQVVSADKDGKDVLSAVRSFAIDKEPVTPTVGEIGERIMGTVYDDGTQLNLGAAAYVNSGVRVKAISSSRLSTYGFRIRLTHLGAADLTRSYIQVKSAAGTPARPSEPRRSLASSAPTVTPAARPAPERTWAATSVRRTRRCSGSSCATSVVGAVKTAPRARLAAGCHRRGRTSRAHRRSPGTWPWGPYPGLPCRTPP